jgi:hypothetical protein
VTRFPSANDSEPGLWLDHSGSLSSLPRTNTHPVALWFAAEPQGGILETARLRTQGRLIVALHPETVAGDLFHTLTPHTHSVTGALSETEQVKVAARAVHTALCAAVDPKPDAGSAIALVVQGVAARMHEFLTRRQRLAQWRLGVVSADIENRGAPKPEAAGRQQLLALRTAIDGKADECMGHAQGLVAEWFGARGKLSQAVTDSVQRISLADFESTDSYSKTVMRLNPRVGAELKLHLQQNSKELFKAASTVSFDCLEASTSDSESAM